MPFAKVQVTKPLNRLIYIDGNYLDPAGNSATDSFTVPTGGHIFETVNGDGKVDYRKRFRVSPRDKKVEIELDLVDPPAKV